MPLLALIGRLILSAGVFAAVDTLVSKILDKDEDSIADEILAAAVSAGVLSKTQTKQIADAARVLPLPKEITTPEQAAKYLETLAANKAGLEALNARLGGFAPLAVKFTQTAARILPKLEGVTFKKVAFVTSLITFLFWLPTLIQQFLDQGTFAPEQANSIFESWGLPFRWPISEVRATEKELEAIRLHKALAGVEGALRDEKPRIIIRMAETSKPQLFTGILFAAPLSKPEAFNRVLDDEITDLADLQNDLKLNLANWVKGLAGRTSVALSVRNNPIISQSEKLSGTWLVASLSYGLVDGGRAFLDTIPLGPINPVKYMPKVSEVKTLENQIFAEFRPETVKELVIPPSALQALTKEGEIVPILPDKGVMQPVVIQTIETQESQRATGKPVVAGTPTQEAALAAAKAAGKPASVTSMGAVQMIVPAAAAAPSAAPGPAPAPAMAAKAKFQVDQIVRVNDPEGLNVRSFSGTAGTKLFAIPIGTTVRIASEPQFKDGFEWYSISVQSGAFSGRGGWVAGEFLT